MTGTSMQPGTSEIMGRELHGPCLWTLVEDPLRRATAVEAGTRLTCATVTGQ
ncbi:MAG: hypothetical protein OXE17_01240 [Chloroflexi bacterium]|nr:hypothetical protein [Chloroflexota bacterium]